MAEAQAVSRQIQYFKNEEKWKGGYFEGDPLDPLASSSYSVLGYMSILHATYLACIKPYVTAKTRALEIGPGRGAWTRALLPAAEVVCLDALSAEHNGFWEYVGHAPNVKYIQVHDFEASSVPDNHFDYLFSFGTFCHISPAGSGQYFTSLFRKLVPGAHGFIMIADKQKLEQTRKAEAQLSAFRLCDKRRYWPARVLWKLLYSLRKYDPLQTGKNRSGGEEEFDRVSFHFLGIERACDMLTKAGFRVLDPDVGTVYRDAIVHFVKP